MIIYQFTQGPSSLLVSVGRTIVDDGISGEDPVSQNV